MSSSRGSTGESDGVTALPGIGDLYSLFIDVFSSCANVSLLSCWFKLGDVLSVTLDFSCNCLFISSNSFRKLANK